MWTQRRAIVWTLTSFGLAGVACGEAPDREYVDLLEEYRAGPRGAGGGGSGGSGGTDPCVSGAAFFCVCADYTSSPCGDAEIETLATCCFSDDCEQKPQLECLDGQGVPTSLDACSDAFDVCLDGDDVTTGGDAL